ncbi:MAG TPA: YdcF family protein [Anaerolineaceae bacterium]|nr:YdcF family protein [Anaerolineaceae bacterium]
MILLVLLVLLILSAPLILRGIGAFLIYADPLEDADSAVALSGDTGDRVSEAAWLYENQFVDYLFITYTDEPARDALLWAAQLEGFPGERVIVTEMQVANTVDEARAIRALAEERAQDSLIIITDPFHTLRTRIIFRNELLGSGISIQVRPVVGHWYRSTTWWRTPEGRRLTLEEYLKILLYFFGKY